MSHTIQPTRIQPSLDSLQQFHHYHALAQQNEHHQSTINDIKFISQRQQHDYTQFKQMIYGANLIPLDIKSQPIDKICAPKTIHQQDDISDNVITHKHTIPYNQLNTVDGICTNQLDNIQTPRTVHDVQRDFNRLNNTELQYKYVIQCIPIKQQLCHIMNNNVIDMLDKIIQSIHRHIQINDCQHIFNILCGVASTNKFNMSVKFLLAAEQQQLIDIFNSLYTYAPDTATIDQSTTPEPVSNNQTATASIAQPIKLSVKPSQSHGYEMMLPGWSNLAGVTKPRTTTQQINQSIPIVNSTSTTNVSKTIESSLLKLQYCKSDVQQLQSVYNL